MSKLGCLCGAVIRDQSDYLPHKGAILKDQDFHEFFEAATKEIASYIDSIRKGTTESWLASHSHRRDEMDSWIVDRAILMAWVEARVHVYE